MTTNDMAVSRPSNAQTILARSVCLTLRCHYLGNDRKVPVAQLVDAAAGTVALDEHAFRARKKLVDQKELTSAIRVIDKAKAYLRSRTISAHRVFGERTYLIPLALVEEVDKTLVAFVGELEGEAALLAGRYAAAIEKQRALLGSLFVASEYRDPSDVSAAFGLDWDYISFAAPERLETVDRALFEGAQRRYESRMAEAYDEVRVVLRMTLRETVAGIVEKLTPSPDGKPKRFSSSILDTLADFLQTFRLRDITDDAELGETVRRLRNLTRGVDAEALRDFDAVRHSVQAGARAVLSDLDKLVQTGRRAISFGELPDAVGQ